jgi:dephospho-CoA kinase
MLNVALTGNAGAGKSTVVRWFAKWGATIIDADALVREVQAPGSETLVEISRRFGKEVILPDGSLDRAALRTKVLGDAQALDELNEIVHPPVQQRRAELVSLARDQGRRIVVNDIPLLFEALDPSDFDLVVLVDAPVSVRRERLIRRGLKPEEADRLIASQLPSNRKRGASDIVIDNDGTLDDLERRCRDAWDTILKQIEE